MPNLEFDTQNANQMETRAFERKQVKKSVAFGFGAFCLGVVLVRVFIVAAHVLEFALHCWSSLPRGRGGFTHSRGAIAR